MSYNILRYYISSYVEELRNTTINFKVSINHVDLHMTRDI